MIVLARRRRPGAQRRAAGARRRRPGGSRGGGAPLGSRGLDYARLCASSGFSRRRLSRDDQRAAAAPRPSSGAAGCRCRSLRSDSLARLRRPLRAQPRCQPRCSITVRMVACHWLAARCRWPAHSSGRRCSSCCSGRRTALAAPPPAAATVHGSSDRHRRVTAQVRRRRETRASDRPSLPWRIGAHEPSPFLVTLRVRQNATVALFPASRAHRQPPSVAGGRASRADRVGARRRASDRRGRTAAES